jgi:hypothetical protein
MRNKVEMRISVVNKQREHEVSVESRV